MSTKNKQHVKYIFSEIMKEKGYSKFTELSAWLGCKRQTLHGWKSRGRIGDYALFTEKGINEDWLRTGKGEMFLPQYPVIDPDKLKTADIQLSTHEENSNTPDPLTAEERILLENYRAAVPTIQQAARTMLADSAKESGGNGDGGKDYTEQKSESK